MSKTARDIWQEWFNGLDEIDQEIVRKVDIIRDDDYPYEVTGGLSAAAAERAGLYKAEGAFWTAAYCPTPPEEYYTTLEQEEADDKALIQAERAAQLQRIRAEEARRDQWMEQTLSGLEPAFIYPPDILPGPSNHPEHWPVRVYFDTQTMSTGDLFRSFEHGGETLWYYSFGNATLVYAPPQMVRQWILDKWAGENQSRRAWSVLESHLSGYITYHGRYYHKAIYAQLGEARLLELARREQYDSSHSLALVSKVHRIPLRHPETGELGFGYWKDTAEAIRRRIADADYAEYLIRLKAWISVEQATDDKMPTPADLARHQEICASLLDSFF